MMEAGLASQAWCISSIHQTLDYNHQNIPIINVILRLYQNKSHSLKYHLCAGVLKSRQGVAVPRSSASGSRVATFRMNIATSVFRGELAMYSCKKLAHAHRTTWVDP